jgi:hypothetical protein
MYLSAEDMIAGRMTMPWVLYYENLQNYSESYGRQTIFEIHSGTFTDDSPNPGYVSWSKIKVKYNGVIHTITNANTNKKWIYWETTAPKVFNSSDVYPTASPYLIIIGENDTGTFTTQWRSEDQIVVGQMGIGAVSADRGDPASDDFTSFTQDTAWHDIDLSAIVPVNYRFVLLRFRGLSSNQTGYAIVFRRKGNVNSINNAFVLAAALGTWVYKDILVSCDTNRKIQYQINNTDVWQSIYLTVSAYWA